MKRPKPTYHIGTRGRQPDRRILKRARMSSHGLSLRQPINNLSSPVGHPIAYRKFVMEKDTKAENTQRICINGFSSFQIHYFPKRLIFDKEELTLIRKD